jgi:hypothetical protein
MLVYQRVIADFPIIRTSIGSPQALKPPEAAALLHRTPPALQLQQLTPLDLRIRQTSPAQKLGFSVAKIGLKPDSLMNKGE